MQDTIGKRLEKYTANHPQEILLVSVEINGEQDQISIFKGFSSSLMRSTSFDPDIPVLPDNATILSIDRLETPYNPEDPRYIQQGISREKMEFLLLATGV